MASTEIDKNSQNFPSFIFMKWTKADEFSEFYDQMLSQRKENMTKCSHKTEGEFQLMWLAAWAASQKKKKKNTCIYVCFRFPDPT